MAVFLYFIHRAANWLVSCPLISWVRVRSQCTMLPEPWWPVSGLHDNYIITDIGIALTGLERLAPTMPSPPPTIQGRWHQQPSTKKYLPNCHQSNLFVPSTGEGSQESGHLFLQCLCKFCTSKISGLLLPWKLPICYLGTTLFYFTI